jgi:uncharacterized membrane protein YhaH (DUF805 family)
MLSTFAWLFLSFSGRISRQEFRLAAMATIVVELLLFHILQNAGSSNDPFYYTSGIALARYQHQLGVTAGLSKLVVAGILIWPRWALMLKRMHDFGLSAKWLLLWVAVVFVATIANPVLFNGIAFVAVFGVLGFTPGVRGSNRFGEDPLSRPGEQLSS